MFISRREHCDKGIDEDDDDEDDDDDDDDDDVGEIMILHLKDWEEDDGESLTEDWFFDGERRCFDADLTAFFR